MMMMKTVKILMTVAALATVWGCSTANDNEIETVKPTGCTFEHADRPAWSVDLTGNDAAPDWGNFNLSLYENSMYVLVTLQEELAAHSTEADRMAVFIGGERRTQLAVPNFYDDGAVRYVLRIYGNSTDRNVRFTLQYYSVALKQLFSIGTEEKFVPEFTYGNIKDFVPPLLKGCKKFPVQNQLTVSLPMARHTADSLRRLVNLIYSRGPLLSKSTGGQFSVDKDLITALDDAGVITSATDFISMVKEQGGLTGLSFEGDKVSFTGFPLTEDADRNKAFQQIACLMNKHALEQKRIQAKVVNDDNERYAFRIWLLRIGMNGDEFKTSRKILMENLSGHTAFRTKEEEARWKARQKEKREELRAEKAASQAVEPTVETQQDAV